MHIRSVLVQLYSRIVGQIVRRKGVIAKHVTFKGFPIISMVSGSNIVIGERTVLVSLSSATALGVPHKSILRTLAKGASISIGEDTGISGAAICSASAIQIGKRVLIGSGVQIFDTDFHTINPLNRRDNKSYNDIKTIPVRIDDDVFIGTRAIICKGVHIGTGSVVGAGSVVVKDVAPYSIVGGNPAVLLKKVPQWN